MRKIYISGKINIILRKYLESLGYFPVFVETTGIVQDGISCHPDIFMCKMGISDDAPIIFAKENEVGMSYPEDVAFNAACTGKYFFHKLAATNQRVLALAQSMGMKMIDVRQGYTKCSMVIVDETSIITYDEGIVKACSRYPEISVLKVQPGHCRLVGFDTGFIGGCSGRVENKVIFNGNLERHPDFRRICDFIRARGLECIWFPEYELTDIGSIIPGME